MRISDCRSYVCSSDLFATSSLPSPLYPIYQADWQLQPSDLTYIYSLYMVGVLTALLCLGRLSDTLSRYTVVCLSLTLMTLGLLLSGVASSINALLIARAIIGLANSLLTTAGARSEEHTSELQSLMRNSYAVFCL